MTLKKLNSLVVVIKAVGNAQMMTAVAVAFASAISATLLDILKNRVVFI